VALVYGWSNIEACLWRDGQWTHLTSPEGAPSDGQHPLKVLRDYPDCCLRPVSAAEEFLRHSLA